MIRLLVALFILSAAAPVSAEIIRMKDGREFEGEILQETPESVKIRERCGESILEIDYAKADIERIRGPADEDKKEEGQVPQNPPGQETDVEEDPGYEQGIDKIITMVKSLKLSWEANRTDSKAARAWLKEASPVIKEFKEKYSRSKRISYSYMKLAFLKLTNFFSCIGDMDEKQSAYRENAKKDVPASVKESIKEAASEYERMACDSLNLADQYLSMAKAKTLK